MNTLKKNSFKATFFKLYVKIRKLHLESMEVVNL